MQYATEQMKLFPTTIADRQEGMFRHSKIVPTRYGSGLQTLYPTPETIQNYQKNIKLLEENENENESHGNYSTAHDHDILLDKKTLLQYRIVLYCIVLY